MGAHILSPELGLGGRDPGALIVKSRVCWERHTNPSPNHLRQAVLLVNPKRHLGVMNDSARNGVNGSRDERLRSKKKSDASFAKA